MLSIKIRTTPETERILLNLPNDWSKALFNGVKRSVKYIEKYIKDSFGKPGNLKVISGKLRDSIIGEVERTQTAVIGILSSNKDYAAIHEYGGTIKATQSQYMTFTINGSWIKTKQVYMPAKPYLEPGLIDNLDYIGDIITDQIAKELN